MNIRSVVPRDGGGGDRCRAAITPDQDGVVAEILRHLAEIGAGRTSITDDDLANAPTDVMRELLVGLLTLHATFSTSGPASRRGAAVRPAGRRPARRGDGAGRIPVDCITQLRTPLSTLKLQTAGLSRWLSQASLPEHEPHLLKHFAVIDRQVARLAHDRAARREPYLVGAPRAAPRALRSRGPRS
jgi:hypothetical protein